MFIEKFAIAAGLHTNLSGQEFTLFDQPIQENTKQFLHKDKLIKKIIKKAYSLDGIVGNTDPGYYNGLVDAYRDNKSYDEEGYYPKIKVTIDDIEAGDNNVYRKIRKNRLHKKNSPVSR